MPSGNLSSVRSSSEATIASRGATDVEAGLRPTTECRFGKN